MMKSWSIDRQAERRSEFLTLYKKFMAPFFDAEGNWQGSDAELGVREKMWHCLALLQGSEEEIAFANKILDLLKIERCHFAPMNCMELLLIHEKNLTASNIQKLEAYVKESITRQSDSRVRFTMYNDNFATMAVFTLLTAGERFGDVQAFNSGKEKLLQLTERYMRCGTFMEYLSPTYTPLNLHILAQIASHVKNKEVSELALKCEERGWVEVATHYHAPSGRLAGPYSRAYTVDTIGHPHCLSLTLYVVFGEDVFINPIKDMFPPHPGQVVHISLERLMWPNMAWLCSSNSHCPDYLAELLLNKKYPYVTIAKTECLPSHVPGYNYDRENGDQGFIANPYEFPAFSGPIYTYMMPDFAMGTACSQYHDGGLTESFYVVYRKKKEAKCIQDTSVVYARYVINERKPEQERYDYAVYDGPNGSITFRDEGRKHGIQHNDCSMMVYKPKQFEAQCISSMKLSIMLPVHFGGVDEVWIGKTKLLGTSGESVKAETVFVKDGPVYMAYTPLMLTDYGRKAAAKVEEINNHLMLSFYNYEGVERAFSMKEMFLTTNGFIALIKSADEFRSFEEFMAYASEYTLYDNTARSEGAYTRWIKYKRRDCNLEFAYSPISEGIMIATVNGKPRPEPVVEATGLNISRLPLL